MLVLYGANETSHVEGHGTISGISQTCDDIMRGDFWSIGLGSFGVTDWALVMQGKVGHCS